MQCQTGAQDGWGMSQQSGGGTLCCYPPQVNLKLSCHQIPQDTSTQVPWETGWSCRGPLRIREHWACLSSLQERVANTEALDPQTRAPDLIPSFAFELTELLKVPAWWLQCRVPPCPPQSHHSHIRLRSLPNPSRANTSSYTKTSTWGIALHKKSRYKGGEHFIAVGGSIK